MKNLFFLIVLLSLSACTDAELQTKLTDMEKELADTKAQLEAATNAEPWQPGMVHSVFFWLKEDLSDEDKASFLKGCQSLATIETVKACYIGPPSSTEARDVVDNSYGMALLVHFDDIEGQNAYQTDPIHLKFIEDHKDKWTKVVVYDNDVVK